MNWSTASELGNIGFIIVRGYEENGDYAELDSYKKNPQLMGDGNSSEEHSYQYIDYDVHNSVTYWYKLLDVDFCGVCTEHGPVSARPNEKTIKLETFYLDQNYPNPFNTLTIISYQLPITSEVELSIYDQLGQKIATLISERQPAGIYKVEWNANKFSSGVYYYILNAGDFKDVNKMMLLK